MGFQRSRTFLPAPGAGTEIPEAENGTRQLPSGCRDVEVGGFSKLSSAQVFPQNPLFFFLYFHPAGIAGLIPAPSATWSSAPERQEPSFCGFFFKFIFLN